MSDRSADHKPYYANIAPSSPEEYATVADVHQSMQEILRIPTVVKAAVMPDACPAGPIGHIPVGGVAVAENAIHPAMHSADICCSVMYTNLGKVPPKEVLDIAEEVTHFGRGGRPHPLILPQELKKAIRNNRFLNTAKQLEFAVWHLGTQGDGNHFLFVGQSRATGDTILVTHHGSRGFGASLYQKGRKVAEQFLQRYAPEMPVIHAWIPADSPEGEDYWEALQIVRQWTKLNHSVLHDMISQRLGVDPTDRFWNEHNFVFRKGHLYYHAKGATPLDSAFLPDARDGRRLVPLNMREPVLIIEGQATERNLGFAPHGAGRNISRSLHKQRFAHMTAEQLLRQETQGLDVRFYCGKIDISELPSAYKDAEALRRQIERFQLGTIVDEILPYGCIMAGDTRTRRAKKLPKSHASKKKAKKKKKRKKKK